MTSAVAALLTCVVAWCQPPWQGAELVPADVDAWVHVDDGASLRHELGSLPGAGALAGALADETLAARWSALAARLRRPGEECFDMLMGRDAALAMRRRGEERDWLMAVELDEAALHATVDGLGGRMLGGGRVEFPGQGFVGVWRAPRLLVAANHDSPLLRFAVERADAAAAAAPLASAPAAGSLASAALVRDAAPWPASRVQLYLRHPPPLGGASVVTAAIDGRTVTLRHRGRFDQSPLELATPPEGFDTRVLARLEDAAILAWVEPQRRTPQPSVVEALLPEAVFTPEMRENAGARWMVAVGALDGRPSTECQVPAVAVAVEVKDAALARRQHDEFMRGVIRGFNTRWASIAGSAIPPPGETGGADVEDPRGCDAGPMFRTATGNHPLVRTASIHWRTVVSEAGNWQVYSSHRAWLDVVARRLEPGPETPAAAPVSPLPALPGVASTPSPDGAPGPGASVRAGAHAGFLRGAALADMLESWAVLAPEFSPADPAAFRDGIRMLARALHGVVRASWELSEPSPGVVQARAEITLAPAQSAAP